MGKREKFSGDNGKKINSESKSIHFELDAGDFGTCKVEAKSHIAKRHAVVRIKNKRLLVDDEMNIICKGKTNKL